MRRLPNPWIAIPALVIGGLAGALGWVVTDVSCRQGGQAANSCSGWAALVAAATFLTVTVGVALVLVLVYRSLAEWRQRTG